MQAVRKNDRAVEAASGRMEPVSKDVLQQLRHAHAQSVIDELLRAGGLSRAELVRRTGLSRTTLTAILSDLFARGAVVERQEEAAAGTRPRGRPSSLVCLNPQAGLLLGVDLSQRENNVTVLNLAHQAVAEGSEPVAVELSWPRRIDKAIRLVDKLVARHGIGLDTLEATGIGMYGIVEDPQLAGTGTLTREARRVSDRFERRFGVPAVLDNTSRLGALAETIWGAAAGSTDVIYVRWSEGVGGGVVVNGRLVRGAHGIAGQVGHVSVDPDGAPCGCGGRGCLNERIRIRTLLDAAIQRGVAVKDDDALLARARDGDPDVCSIITRAARDLGVTLAALAVHVDPARIVIGGEMAEFENLVLEPVRETVRSLALPSAARVLEIVPAALGTKGAALGAVAQILQDAASPGRRPGLRTGTGIRVTP